MTRLLFSILFGLVLGGIIHIVTVFGIPRVAENDAWARVATLGPDLRFNPVPNAQRPPLLPLLDPAFAHHVCRFTLADGPIRVRAVLPDVFWSLAIFDGRGANAYNLSDRAAGQKPVDLLVANADQIAQIRGNPPADFNDIIIVDWSSPRGFVLFRIFAPTASDQQDAANAVSRATCQVTPLE